MSLKQSFADQVKAQSDVWKAQIKDYQEQLEQAGQKIHAPAARQKWCVRRECGFRTF